MISDKLIKFEQNSEISIEETIWDICYNFFDKKFLNKSIENYNFVKSSYAKSLTVKILNNEEFINLLICKYNEKKIFYFSGNDEFELAKFYVRDKNIEVKRKRKINFRLIRLKIVIFFLPYFFFKIQNRNPIIFLVGQKKYNPIFLMCKKFIKNKNKFEYIGDFRSFLLKNIKFSFKKKRDLIAPKILLKSNLETIYNIIILQNLIKEYLSISKPKAIISVEGDSTIHSTFAYFCPKQTKSICFQWGSFTKDYVKNGFKNMYQKTKFVWSDYYKKKFIEDNKNTNFIKAGNPLLKNNKGNKRTDILFIMNPKEVYINDKLEDDFLKLIKWTNKFKDKKIIIRFHPADTEERIRKFKNEFKNYNIIFHNGNEIRIEESIKNTHIAIGVRSSALIEIAKVGIIPIVFNNPEAFLEDFFKDIKNYGHYCENINQCKKLLNILLIKEKKNKSKIDRIMQNLGDRYISYIDKPSELLIAKELRKI